MSTRADILNALITSAKTMTTSDDYDPVIRHVEPYVVNFQTTRHNTLLMVEDTGQEELVCEDATDVQFKANIRLHGYVKRDNEQRLRTDFNDAYATVIQWLTNRPSIDDRALDLRYVNTESFDIFGDQNEAVFIINARIVYAVAKGTSEAGGTEVYGDSWEPTARGHLKTQLEALATSIASYDPKFSTVYNRHRVANISTNAVTIELNDGASEEIYGCDVVVSYPLTYSVRVHTGYIGGFHDTDLTARLLTGIINKLKANIHIDTSDYYRIQTIESVTVNNEFPESGTVGGECLVTVETRVEHTQE